MRHALILSLCVLVSCSKSEEPRGAASVTSASAPAASVAASVEPALTVPPMGSDVPEPPTSIADLQTRFANEAKNRPKGTVTAEQAFAAFAKAGVPFKDAKQHLARPFDAMYCSGGKTPDDLAVSICEYKNHAEAEAGRTQSLKVFATVPNRQIFVNNGTTLTIRVGQATPSNDAAAKSVIEAFKALKP